MKTFDLKKLFILAQNAFKKGSKAFLFIPILTFVLGLSLSQYIYSKMHEREISDQRAESFKKSKEYLQSLDLLISNSILRIQSYEEYLGTRPSDYKKDSAVLAQSLPYTIFQKFSIVQLISWRSNGDIKLKMISQIKTPTSSLPLVKENSMSREIRASIEELFVHKGYSQAVLHEHNGTPLITYILQSRAHGKIFFVFTAPLIALFEKTDLRPSETIDIEDSKTGFAWTVASDGAKKTIKASSRKTADADGPALQTLSLGDPEQAALKVQFHFNYIQDGDRIKPSLITGLLSVFITLIISYLFWVLVTQNRVVSRMVIDKTHDLEKIHQELQEALITKTRFLGNISHEIRTPLNLILGMIDLCEEKDTDKKLRDYLSSMRSSGNHLLSMIEDLLDLAKSETNEIQLQPRNFHLLHFLSDVAKISGRDCAKKNLRLYVEFDFNLPTLVKCDPSRLRQILLNLLRNACKYTSEGHVTLRASVLRSLTENIQTLRFEVEDTGIGIQHDKLQKIFDAFFQVENSYAFSEGGVGLGLAIVKELVRKLEGRLSVQSVPKKGSLFQVDLDIEVLDPSHSIEYYRPPDSAMREFILISSDMLLEKSTKPLSMHSSVVFTQIPSVSEVPPAETSKNRWYLLDTIGSEFSKADIKKLAHAGNMIFLGHKEELLEKYPGLSAPVIESSPLLLSEVLTASGFLGKRPHRKEHKDPVAADGTSVRSNIPNELNVLVADDDMGNQELYKAYFEGKSWSVHYTMNGEEALQSYMKNPCDVLILDVRMPVMDGFEAAERVRAYESEKGLPQRPILLVTADALEETMKKAETIPGLSFLTKPIRKSTLMDSLTTAISKDFVRSQGSELP
ncbi:hybrid sensor histidine kinase/response regulator [Bdellovibrio bacteriovorus]|uniref:hybrid sensor histidine kinase/response regulator n=1 Tax=Bdellovibrio bacteriovorus TaxID=959 RepID=UPI0035A6C1C6